MTVGYANGAYHPQLSTVNKITQALSQWAKSPKKQSVRGYTWHCILYIHGTVF